MTRTLLLLLSLAAACQDHALASRSGPFVGDTRYIPPPSAPEGTGVARRYGGGGGVTVWMNFDGGDLSCGMYDDSADDESAIACEWGGGAFPAFDDSGFGCSGTRDECIGLIMDEMRDLWLDYNISFTTGRPGSGDYEAVWIGGSVGGGAAGVALLDCGNSFPSNVSFVFSDVLAGVGSCSRGLVVTAASQELAHALGLCHNDDCDGSPSVMCPYTADCDSEWSCGDQVDSCYCEGYGYDPYCPSDYLYDLLGPSTPDTTPPTVSIVEPFDGAVVPPTFTLTAEASDDRAVERVEIYAGDSDTPGGEDFNAPYTFMPEDWSDGPHVFRVMAYDEAGNTAEDSITVTVSSDTDCVKGICCGEACCEQAPCCPDCADLAPTGSRCVEPEECQGGICEDSESQPDIGDICSQSCDEEADCPTGFDCINPGADGLCWPSVGKACEENSQCPGGACLSGPEGSFCTVPCSDDTSCPGDYECESIESLNVCVPAAAEETGDSGDGGCGCAIGGRSGAGGGAAALLALVALAAAVSRRRAR